jgi:hypothetical protein
MLLVAKRWLSQTEWTSAHPRAFPYTDVVPSLSLNNHFRYGLSGIGLGLRQTGRREWLQRGISS